MEQAYKEVEDILFDAYVSGRMTAVEAVGYMGREFGRYGMQALAVRIDKEKAS